MHSVRDSLRLTVGLRCLYAWADVAAAATAPCEEERVHREFSRVHKLADLRKAGRIESELL